MVWLLGAAIVAVLYPYVIFPGLLAVIGRKPETPSEPAELPRVALLVSAFIEGERIADKIRNFQSFDYPADRIDLWIGTDGSPDNTAEIVRNSMLHGFIWSSVRSAVARPLFSMISHRGPMRTCLSSVMLTALTGRIRSGNSFATSPIRGVGVVSGRTIIRGRDGQAIVEGAYYRFESWLKLRESGNGWLPGALGAVYAIRANLYKTLAPEIINDLAHPCQVVAMGYKCRFDPTAISEEAAGDDAGREFSRQTRMTAQAAYVLATYIPQLLRSGRLGMLWILLSHKWLRWTAGLWIIAAVCVLPFISLPLTVLAVIAAVALFSGWKANRGWATLPVYFLMVHTAYLNGLRRALQGERYVVWKPRAG